MPLQGRQTSLYTGLTMRKLLIITGIVLLIAGILLPYIIKFPLGRLPGDIVISRPGFRLYFPMTTMIIISLVITFISWFLNR